MNHSVEFALRSGSVPRSPPHWPSRAKQHRTRWRRTCDSGRGKKLEAELVQAVSTSLTTPRPSSALPPARSVSAASSLKRGSSRSTRNVRSPGSSNTPRCEHCIRRCVTSHSSAKPRADARPGSPAGYPRMCEARGAHRHVPLISVLRPLSQRSVAHETSIHHHRCQIAAHGLER